MNSGKITFKGVEETAEITVGENIYVGNLIYNADKTQVTIGSKYASAEFKADSNVTLINSSKVTKAMNISGGADAVTIIGGNGADVITGGAGANSISGGKGNDIINGGEGTGVDTFTGGAGNDVFVYEGGEVVITDFLTGKNIISVASGSAVPEGAVSGNDLILTFDEGEKVTLEGAANKTISIKSGETTTAYIFGDHYTMNTKKTEITMGENFSGKFNGAAYSTLVTIDASAAGNAVDLTGNSKANKMYGGAGADTLDGGKGNDTLTGGDGADVFVYVPGQGKDVITDYTPGQDEISIVGGVSMITNATFSGNKLVLTVNKQTLTIQNEEGITKDTKIKINGTEYTFDTKQIASSDGVTMYSAFKGAYTAPSGIKTIDGTLATGTMNITGSSDANTILGGRKSDTLSGGAGADSIFGGAGNDYIVGGTGKDTLTGGAGNDIFVYSEGDNDDVITDYTAKQDKIKIQKGDYSVTTSGADAVIQVGSGTITIKDAAEKAITIIDQNGKTTTKNYGTANARTLELLYDNNYMTDDAVLDDITDAKYSVTDIETDNNKDELDKIKEILAYSDKK